ncbi:MAG: hypothetical protein IPP90_11010 [Gemmatimonadaceae bacterium]|nr:hypothetical protein [Gemmatimonadaceae bacterium]
MIRRIGLLLRVLRVLCGSSIGLAFANAHAVQPTPPRWKGTVDLTIGGTNAADGADFGRITGLTVDAAGRIFVSDWDDDQIRAFSPSGALASRIGRKGSGPIEFKGLATITIGPDGMLWVRDEGNARMQVINVRSNPASSVATFPLKQFTGGSRLPIVFTVDGSLVDETISFDQASGGFRPLSVRRSKTGDVLRVDTLKIPEGANAGVHKVTEVQKDAAGKQIGVSQRYFRQPFGPAWLRAYGPGGVRAEAVGSKYDVTVFGADGRVVRTLKRTIPPVTLSAAERRRADSTINAQKTDLPFGVPSAKPPVVGLAWTLGGELWVERSHLDGRPREADVYNKDGALIAIAEWPADIDLLNGFPSINGTTVVAVHSGDEGLESIVRLRFR